MTKAVRLDIVSDVVCPWCYVGKRRLERALAGLTDMRVETVWHPFQLDSTIPEGGMSREAYLTRKFGSAERIAGLHAPLLAASKPLGISFAFARIAVSPNTLKAHRLIALAGEQGRQDAMVERLFVAYFTEGQDIGDSSVLARLAGSCGVAAEAEDLSAPEALAAIAGAVREVQDAGISSVPTFLIARRYAVVGAQPPEVLAAALTRAALEMRAETEAPARP